MANLWSAMLNLPLVTDDGTIEITEEEFIADHELYLSEDALYWTLDVPDFGMNLTDSNDSDYSAEGTYVDVAADVVTERGYNAETVKQFDLTLGTGEDEILYSYFFDKVDGSFQLVTLTA